jgi:hypothetical protein
MAHGLVNALNIYEVPLIVLGGTVAIKQKSKIVMLDSLVEKYFRGPKKVNIVFVITRKRGRNCRSFVTINLEIINVAIRWSIRLLPMDLLRGALPKFLLSVRQSKA